MGRLADNWLTKLRVPIIVIIANFGRRNHRILFSGTNEISSLAGFSSRMILEWMCIEIEKE